MNKLIINRKALELRKLFGVDHQSPIDLFALISGNPNITLIHYPFGDEISGICIQSASLIAINNQSTKGRQNFSLAHELYHLYFDKQKSSISYFNDSNGNDKIEKEANLFASYLLMPDSSFTEMIYLLTNNLANKITVLDILKIEQHFQVSRRALLIRLVMEGYLLEEDIEQFTKDVLKTAIMNGYDKSLYQTTKISQPKTYGAYLKNALKLFSSNLISEGKYKEYLLDAYRSDIIYDFNGDDDIYD